MQLNMIIIRYYTQIQRTKTEQPSILYAACGDNNAYAWDLNTKQCISTFRGHTGYLHCITQRANGQLVTGSEDGTVKLWGTAIMIHKLRGYIRH
jgi:WD40 repeat protein